MKKSKGALTVEACLAFTISMFVMILLMFFIKVVYVHATIQHAITQAANDVASYSYVYSISPFAVINDTIVDSTSDNIDTLNNDIGDLVGVYDSVVQFKEDAAFTYNNTKDFASGMSDIGGIGDIQNSINQAQGIYDSAIATGKSAKEAVESIKTGANTVKDMISDPKALLKNIISVFASTANEEIKTFLGTQLVKSFMTNYLTDGDINSKMAAMQIVGGFDGIDFSGSRFFADKENISIVACYQIESVVPDWILKDMYLINRAYIRGWLNNVSMPTSVQKQESSSVWDTDTQLGEGENGELEVDDRGMALKKKLGYTNLPHNHKLWSYKDGVATKGMTIKMSEESYAKDSVVKSKIKTKLDVLNGEKTVGTYEQYGCTGGEVKSREFYILIPPNTTSEDKARLNKVVAELKSDPAYKDIKIHIDEVDLSMEEADY